MYKPRQPDSSIQFPESKQNDRHQNYPLHELHHVT